MEAAKRLRYCRTARSIEQLHLKVFVAFWIQDTQGGEKLEHHKSSLACARKTGHLGSTLVNSGFSVWSFGCKSLNSDCFTSKCVKTL